MNPKKQPSSSETPGVSGVGVILVRYGEIGLKGKNRPAFENMLVRRIQRALKDSDVQVRKEAGRITVVPSDTRGDHAPSIVADRLSRPTDAFPTPQHLEKVSRIFGVVSVSPALRVDLNLPAVEKAAKTVLGAKLGEREGNPSTTTFKVETRRANKRFPVTSPEVSRQLGGALLGAFPQLKVDVYRPQMIVWVELRDTYAYVYTDDISGPGGLPIGVSGKALLLLSGGIDSPVAGWYAMKRGIDLEAVYFHTFPHTSERALLKVLQLARIVGDEQGVTVPVHVVNFTPMQDEIQRHARAASRITIMRRMMVRMAEQLARQRGLMALVTGESIGQVASQTLESMVAINAVTHMPIIRPLVAMDKRDIVDQARHIGTYETSILPYDDCCTLFVPPQPETRPQLDRIEAMESSMNYENLVAEAVNSAELQTADPDLFL